MPQLKIKLNIVSRISSKSLSVKNSVMVSEMAAFQKLLSFALMAAALVQWSDSSGRLFIKGDIKWDLQMSQETISQKSQRVWASRKSQC